MADLIELPDGHGERVAVYACPGGLAVALGDGVEPDRVLGVVAIEYADDVAAGLVGLLVELFGLASELVALAPVVGGALGGLDGHETWALLALGGDGSAQSLLLGLPLHDLAVVHRVGAGLRDVVLHELSQALVVLEPPLELPDAFLNRRRFLDAGLGEHVADSGSQLGGALAQLLVPPFLVGHLAGELGGALLEAQGAAHAVLDVLEGAGQAAAGRPLLVVGGEPGLDVRLGGPALVGHGGFLAAQMDERAAEPPQLVEGAVVLDEHLGLLVATAVGEVLEARVAVALFGGHGLAAPIELGHLVACPGQLVGLEHLSGQRPAVSLQDERGAGASADDEDGDAGAEAPDHQQGADGDGRAGDDGAADNPLAGGLALALAGLEDAVHAHLGLVREAPRLLDLRCRLRRGPLVVEDEPAVLRIEVPEPLFEAIELLDGGALVDEAVLLAADGGTQLALAGLEVACPAEQLGDPVDVVLGDRGQAPLGLEVAAGGAECVCVELGGALLGLLGLPEDLEALDLPTGQVAGPLGGEALELRNLLVLGLEQGEGSLGVPDLADAVFELGVLGNLCEVLEPGLRAAELVALGDQALVFGVLVRDGLALGLQLGELAAERLGVLLEALDLVLEVAALEHDDFGVVPQRAVQHPLRAGDGGVAGLGVGGALHQAVEARRAAHARQVVLAHETRLGELPNAQAEQPLPEGPAVAAGAQLLGHIGVRVEVNHADRLAVGEVPADLEQPPAVVQAEAGAEGRPGEREPVGAVGPQAGVEPPLVGLDAVERGREGQL